MNFFHLHSPMHASLQPSWRHSWTGHEAKTPGNHICLEGMHNVALLYMLTNMYHHKPTLPYNLAFIPNLKLVACFIPFFNDHAFVTCQYNVPSLRSQLSYIYTCIVFFFHRLSSFNGVLSLILLACFGGKGLWSWTEQTHFSIQTHAG